MRPLIRTASLRLLCGCAVLAQQEATLDGRPVRVISNDKLSLTMQPVGGTMVQLLILADGKLTIEDRTSGKKIVLTTSRGL